MCAMMPMFRTFSIGYGSAISVFHVPGPMFQVQLRRSGFQVPGSKLSVPFDSGPTWNSELGTWNCSLPAIVGERLIRLGHFMGVFLFLHRVSSIIGRLDQLCSQTFRHRFLGPLPGEGDDPSEGERGPA